MMFFERKVSKSCLWNRKIDMYQRVVTFEGFDYFAEYCKFSHAICVYYRETLRAASNRHTSKND